MIEKTTSGNISGWIYLDLPKGENVFAHRIADKFSNTLRGVARYISHGDNTDDLPILVSDKGYGFVLATSSPAYFCDIAAYSTYICMEETQIDYYFVAGSDQQDILMAYNWLIDTHVFK